MTRVFISSLHDKDSQTLRAARAILSQFPLQKFELTDRLCDAGIVLYLENGYVGLSKLPELMRRICAAPNAQHLMFSESDWPYPILPGAFPSLTKATRWADGWSYLIQRPVETRHDRSTPRYLFSFLGRISTHPIRAEILRLDSSDTPCVDLHAAPKRLESFDFATSYIDLMKNSQFVLCPRGIGASSIRIFEAMSYGCVPVIIGDAWKEPPCANWKRFSVRIAEDQIDTIPERLSAIRHRASEMGMLAADVFRDLYAPEVFLDRLLSFLTNKHAREPTSITRLLLHALRAAGWREIKTIAHQLLRRGT